MLNLNRYAKRGSAGFTLMEAAIVIAVLGVMSIGFSNLFFTAVDTQNNQAIHVHEQSLLTTLISQIRTDVLTAGAGGLTLPNATTLRITQDTGQQINYVFNGTTITRTVGATAAFDYLTLLPATMRANHTLTCGGSGFPCLALPNNNRVSIRFLRIRDTSAISGPFEAAFNRKAQFMVSEASFNTLMGYTFN
jgi:type II secretory pathway pseudopilin PulG